jgi:hypothetical protein
MNKNNIWIINNSPAQKKTEGRNLDNKPTTTFHKNVYVKTLEEIINNPELSRKEALKEKIMLEKVMGKVLEAENNKLGQLIEREEEKKRLAKEAEEIMWNFQHDSEENSFISNK